MIIISDASPINYLVLIGHIDVLPVLFGRVIIPPTVLTELQSPGASAAVQVWAASPPQWLEIQAPAKIDTTLRLGAGEREAIGLAQELGADQLLIDDLAGRRAAVSRGLIVAGTAAVIVASAKRGLLNLTSAVSALRQTNFRAGPTIWQWLSSQQIPPP